MASQKVEVCLKKKNPPRFRANILISPSINFKTRGEKKCRSICLQDFLYIFYRTLQNLCRGLNIV